MKWDITEKALECDFVGEVEKISGEDISSCYQCGCCSAGCPICVDMDISPNQIMRLVQLGLKEQVLDSTTIWLCASCQTCTSRCPLEVDLAKVMDGLRLIARREGYGQTGKKGAGSRTAEGIAHVIQLEYRSNVLVFSKVFLKSIRDYGRMSEMNLIANYNINSGNLLSNMANAPVFIAKGKLALSKGEAGRIRRARRIFEKVEEIEGIKL